MATSSYNEANGAEVPHEHYNSHEDHNHANNNIDQEQSENSDQGGQSRYLAHLARGRAANFFINGDSFFPSKKIVYNPKHFRDFTHYMDYLTDKLEPNFGAVRKICTPHHGHRIRDLRDLQENGVYVVAGKERFKPYQYEQIMPYDRKRPLPLNYNGEPVNYGRQYVTSGRIKKCETQSMLIKVWPNGEDLKGPRRVLLTPRVKPFTLSNVVAHVNEILKEDCLGTVERLYFLTGIQVSDVDQIAHNGLYVACKRAEKFKRARYTEHGTKNLSTSPRLQRKLLAPLYPRSTNNLSESSPEQSNPSTQSSVISNSNRRRVPYDDDRAYPVKPSYRTSSSERTNTFDLDKDQGGLFKAKQTNRNTLGARPVHDSRETKTEAPTDDFGHGGAGGYQHTNGYSNYPNPRSRQPQPPVRRTSDTLRERSPDKVKHGHGNTKKHKELTSKQPSEPKHFEQFSTGNRLHDEDNAASKIQAAFRGHEVRQGLKSPKQQNTSSDIKPRSYDDRLEEYDKAAEKVQAAYRGHEAREELKAKKLPDVPKNKLQHTTGNRLGDEEKAATKIQAAYRGHRARRELKSPGSAETKKPSRKHPPVNDGGVTDKDAAAAKIQAAYRGHETRKNLSNNKDRPEKSEDEDEKHRSATKIQASYRGYQQRKSAENEHAAAAKIQAGYRGYQTRKELGSPKTVTPKDEAATKIQAGYRGYQTRKRSSVENAAATKIQSGYRGHLARKDLDSGNKTPSHIGKDAEKEAAASKIQAGVRGHLARKKLANKPKPADDQDDNDELARENDAAVTIQSHYRGYRARKDFSNRRTAASNDKYWP